MVRWHLIQRRSVSCVLRTNPFLKGSQIAPRISFHGHLVSCFMQMPPFIKNLGNISNKNNKSYGVSI